MIHKRLVKLAGATNFRDIGGYQSSNKQIVKWGKIYRSDSLSSLTPKDLIKLRDLNLVVDCDLRSPYEQEMSPDRLWPNVEYVDAHLYPENTDDITTKKHTLEKLIHHIPKLDNYLGDIYQQVLLNHHSQKMFALVFEKLLKLQDQQALVFHCSAGKDRTGMTAALILMALGINDDQIAKDYLLTNELYGFSRIANPPSEDEIANMVSQMNITKGEGTAILGITETIRAGWGNFDNFFMKVLGFDKHDLDVFRQMYLE